MRCKYEKMDKSRQHGDHFCWKYEKWYYYLYPPDWRVKTQIQGEVWIIMDSIWNVKIVLRPIPPKGFTKWTKKRESGHRFKWIFNPVGISLVLEFTRWSIQKKSIKMSKSTRATCPRPCHFWATRPGCHKEVSRNPDSWNPWVTRSFDPKKGAKHHYKWPRPCH